VLLNNLFTALNGVWMKKASMSGRCSKMGVLFYNSLFSAIIMFSFFIAEDVYITISSSSPNVPSDAHWRPGKYLSFPPPRRHLSVAELSDWDLWSSERDLLRFGAMQGSNLSRPTLLTWSPSHPERHLMNLPSPDARAGAHPGLQLQLLLQQVKALQLQERVLHENENGALPLPLAATSLLRGRLVPSSSTATTTATAAPQLVSSSVPQSPAAPAASASTDASPPTLHPQSTLSRIYHYERWNDWSFFLMFILAAFMGSVLNYSIFLCTTLNSALTTAVVGALKNVAVTYMGMVLFADYAFSWVNFIGINISIAGSLYYTYITIFKGVKGFGGA
jgi:hypothetical protein